MYKISNNFLSIEHQTTSYLRFKQLLQTLEKEMADTALVRAGVLSTCRVVRLT